MSEHNIMPEANQKQKRVVICEDPSTDDDSSIEHISRPRRKVVVKETDSDSSMGSSAKKRIVRVVSESSSDSSDLDVNTRKTKTSVLESDSGSDDDSSEWESEDDFKSDPCQPSSSKTTNVEKDESSDNNDDGQTEKCPICLAKFKFQEVGSPESCDHSFCAECIREWSKSVNTCPVDRKKFNIILVRSSYEGKYVRSINIHDSSENNLFNNEIGQEDMDSSPCEVCGSSLDEDRLLLCDRCDLAYHLACLDPPLTEVPEGEWYCPVCDDPADQVVNMLQFEFLVNRVSPIAARQTPRLIPRTRQTERIRTRIVHQLRQNNDESSYGTDSSADEISEIHHVRSRTKRPAKKTSTTKRKTTRRKKPRRKTKSRYKLVYEIDDNTGEKIAIKKKIRKYRKKYRKTKKKKVLRRIVAPKSIKNRLARQLGIQAPKKIGQSLPDMKVRVNPDDITIRRSQAGIPALHLFGQRHELDYFSGSDVEYERNSGPNICVSRRPNLSDAALARRTARKKAIVLGTEASTSSTIDLLGSILESQTKLHSKNSVLSVATDGTVKVDVNKKISNPLRDNGANRIRQAPMYSNNTTTSGGNSSGYSNSNQHSSDRNYYHQYESTLSHSSGRYSAENQNDYNRAAQDDPNPQDYSLNTTCSYELEKDAEKTIKSAESDRNTPVTNSDSELDIYSDIETTETTNRYEEGEMKCPTPPVISSHTPDDDNDSDTDLIIDTEKPDSDKYDPATVFESDEDEHRKDVTLTSTNQYCALQETDSFMAELETESIQSHNHDVAALLEDDVDETEEPEDDCPNFSIYSSESINLAKNTDFNCYAPPTSEFSDVSQNINENRDLTESEVDPIPSPKAFKSHSALYSDSEDETFMKVDPHKPFGIGDLKSMTEDISEEERSYTPCLDEKEQPTREGLEGLDTEMISDDDKNDFEEILELNNDPQAQQQAIQDLDALEINAKESELDFSKPDDAEDGEMSDKLKFQDLENEPGNVENTIKSPSGGHDVDVSQEAETVFKKLSKNNKGRNYRDKDKAKEKSKSVEKQNEYRKEKRKDKRMEIALYDVRSVIESRPKRDKFGRDPTIRRQSISPTKSVTPPRRFETNGALRSMSGLSKSPTSPPVRIEREELRIRSPSLSSRSRTPPLRRKTHSSPVRSRKTKKSRSISRSRLRKGSRSRQRKRPTSDNKNKSKQKYDRSKTISEKPSRKRRSRSRSPVLYRRQNWNRRHSRDWTPSLSRSVTPEYRQMTPPWTPPRVMESSVRPQNLRVTLPNKKKTEKRKKSSKKRTDGDRPSKRKRNRSPQPAKEVFTSGNNILVSVSFNKENEGRSRRLKTSDPPVTRKVTRESHSRDKSKSTRKKTKLVTNIKPVAIIDLERSPFRVITPPNDVIILSDSDPGDTNDLPNSLHREPTPHAASPEPPASNSYINTTGPKTPPEPQVKFTFSSKQTQLRAISNPLLDADDVDEEIDPQEELENRLNEVMHKGPNTPPEPPNSPPSSPDAYDPFEPTKSRSPTPEPAKHMQSDNIESIEDSREEISEQITIDLSDKCVSPVRSHTPPLGSSILQPVDTQSSIRAVTPDANRVKSPERTIGVIINQIVQTPVITKAVPPTFSSVPSSIVTSTPISSNMVAPRINILNSTIITQSTSLPRIVLPNITKSSPINKVSPSKTPVKLTPIKPMPAKNIAKLPLPPMVKGAVRKAKIKAPEIILDFDSPYSPRSSDYDDLFDPPPDIAKTTKMANKNTKPPLKSQNAFDALFGSSPTHARNKNKKKIIKKPQRNAKATKLVGVKLDEDNLKILDELPNSAVELQVKDKFLKKLNRQERVVEEVKFVLKPFYNKKRISKEEYKEILRRAVPKICHNKSGEINPKKIQRLVVAYVKKVKHAKKATSNSVPHAQTIHNSQNTHPQKTEAVSNWLSMLN